MNSVFHIPSLAKSVLQLPSVQLCHHRQLPELLKWAHVTLLTSCPDFLSLLSQHQTEAARSKLKFLWALRKFPSFQVHRVHISNPARKTLQMLQHIWGQRKRCCEKSKSFPHLWDWGERKWESQTPAWKGEEKRVPWVNLKKKKPTQPTVRTRPWDGSLQVPNKWGWGQR